MKRPDTYTRSERKSIADGLRSGDPATCPRCGGRLDEWPVPPRSDVSYVRDRLWLVCAACARSVILDRHDPKG
jgi:ribosomal protein S27AE